MPKTTLRRQLELFAENEYPTGLFTPLHHKFRGTARVLTNNSAGEVAGAKRVNLTTGECDCQWGAAFRYDPKEGRWMQNRYCIHKLKAISSLIDTHRDEERAEMEVAYAKALMYYFNQFELVSAFHKELRRGAQKDAFHYAMVLAHYRGPRSPFQYMYNIIYEETRDHDLAAYLFRRIKADMLDWSDLSSAVTWFCASIKKWELSHRVGIFESEMRGYGTLVNDFGADVAKGGNIIPAEHYHELLHDFLRGIDSDDPILAQRGLKGLQKIQYGDFKTEVKLRQNLLGILVEIAGKRRDRALHALTTALTSRITAGARIGYHDINMLADALLGEPVKIGVLDRNKTNRIIREPKYIGMKLGRQTTLPLYAHDNHTHRGKALMGRYRWELKPGADQEHLDFRYCGAYYGVAWRMYAYAQHHRIDVPWGSVRWKPAIHEIVEKMWY